MEAPGYLQQQQQRQNHSANKGYTLQPEYKKIITGILQVRIPTPPKMTDSRRSDMTRMLTQSSSRRRTTKAADFVPGGTTQLRSLDHLPLQTRTPQPHFSRLHTSAYMPRHQEDKARRWIQRPKHEYEPILKWSDHAHRQFSTGTWLDGDDGHFSTGRPSLTPTDGSGGYDLYKRQWHRNRSDEQQPTVQRRRQSRDTRDYDVRYQEMMGPRRPSRGYFDADYTRARHGSHGGHSGHRSGGHRSRHHDRDYG
ncbi:hypothetical protein LTR70_009918 [Exophiala xenobiotica]|uniref:Uncharacterized protein n=1 Tax=Lithohypha guttulata TaxID=1690604 RepID=A0ABR0JVT3_9EURO|nr:hypothetical protein LTR24_009839 [Lithohypha guttulata]KAK5309868.1 hypothetical protein LTR70_009918 [Exophiala xenobiotica]